MGVAVAGPRVISIAARLADRIDLMLGAGAKRIRWGMAVAREAREAGLEGDIPFSAHVNMVVHDDGGPGPGGDHPELVIGVHRRRSSGDLLWGSVGQRIGRLIEAVGNTACGSI